MTKLFPKPAKKSVKVEKPVSVPAGDCCGVTCCGIRCCS